MAMPLGALKERTFSSDISRRNVVRALSLAPLVGCHSTGQRQTDWQWAREEAPLYDLTKAVTRPVVIKGIEVLRHHDDHFVRLRDQDGAEGLIMTKQMADFLPIFANEICPIVLGQDARNAETLVDKVYRLNYKMAGQALWAPYSYLDQAMFDLLGKVAGVAIHQLLGGAKRKHIPVYLSGSGRNTSAEEEVAVYEQGMASTGAPAVKFKIGGRMSRNKDTYPGRTETLIALARKRLGDKAVLYADANGSYDANKAIEVGKQLQDQGYGFFEEPCPFEEVSETVVVAKALTIPIAAGEMDSSFWKFHHMMSTGMMRIVQPDLNYCGGFVRLGRIARMARRHGLTMTPHNTQHGATAANMLHFAAAHDGLGPYMEHVWRAPQKTETWFAPNFPIENGKIAIPTGPGMGVTFDEVYIKGAEVVLTVES